MSGTGGPGDLLMLIAAGLAWAMAMTVEWSDIRRSRAREARLAAAARLVSIEFAPPDEPEVDDVPERRPLEAA